MNENKKMNVTRQTISKWELNETTPDIKQAKELSKIFKISLDELTNNDINDLVMPIIYQKKKYLKLISILINIYLWK